MFFNSSVFVSPKSHDSFMFGIFCLQALMMFKMPRAWTRILDWTDLELHSDLLFFIFFPFFLLTYDAVLLAKKKKENVKSCIIYEICIKEKCNSIINKILIQFLELVVQREVFVVKEGDWCTTDVYQQLHLKVCWPRLSLTSASPAGHPQIDLPI